MRGEFVGGFAGVGEADVWRVNGEICMCGGSRGTADE